MENGASETVNVFTTQNVPPTVHIKHILPLRQARKMMTMTMT